jgi:hypothetical protein
MRRFLDDHPDVATGALLSLAFLAALAWAGRGVDLGPRQWLVLAVASVVTAGLCAWIIGWEADEDEPIDAPDASPAADRAPEEAVDA